MNPLLVLCAAGCISWLLRVIFINLIPARTLPAGIRTALDAAGPAAIAALIATDLSRLILSGGPLPAALAATAVASAITLRFQSLGLTAAAGIAVYWLGSLVIG